MTDGSDLEWLGLQRTGDHRWSFHVSEPLARLDGKFYGGTGIAAATAAMEAETGRVGLWTTVQFVSGSDAAVDVDLEVEVLAAGRRTSQLRVTAWTGSRLLFTATGATGEPRPGGLATQFATMPDVPEPDEVEPWEPQVELGIPKGRPGWMAITDIRRASESSMWMRAVGRPLTRPAMAFMADVIPNAVVRAAGRLGAGTSLDNSVRFGPEPEGDWLLVEIIPHLISGGYVHGSAHLWSAKGTLLGVASQTASLIFFDEGHRRPR